jgi:signal transduction histidine kinase
MLLSRSLGSYSSHFFAFALTAESVVISVLKLDEHLLEILLQLHRVESRISQALSICRRGDSGRILQLIQRERERMGHQLHTGLGQLLATISIQSEIIRKQAPEVGAAGQEALARIETIARQAHEEVRSISRQLYGPEWQRLSLDEALRQLWQNSGVPQRFAASTKILPLPFEPQPAVKTLLYRAAQEGISNLTRHAKAIHVHLELSSAEGWVELMIKDDGLGFDVARLLQGPVDVSSGIGLRALREEAALLGGRFIIRSGPRGTTLQLFVPLQKGRMSDAA